MLKKKITKILAVVAITLSFVLGSVGVLDETDVFACDNTDHGGGQCISVK